MTSSERELSFYRSQTENTDLGPFGFLASALPDDPEAVFAAARNVVEHHAGLNAERIASKRLVDIDIHRVRDMLHRVVDSGSRDLLQEVPFEAKSVGNCFNISKLACGLLREKGIPARLRYAYCTYFYDDFRHEQTLLEYWNAAERRWMRGDASVNRPVLKHLGITTQINLRDVSPELSQPVANVWLACRRGDAEFNSYGASIKHRKRAGIGNVALKLTQDLACLNNVELMPWDFVSSRRKFQGGALDVQEFDRIAELLAKEQFPDLLYSAGNLPFNIVPRRILRMSPYTGISVRKVNIPWKTT